MLTHFSLFTGIGGIDLAAEWAGFTTAGQCEFADYPYAVLEKHWPGIPKWKDIRDVTTKSFKEKTGLQTVTLLSGGFPCQPHSVSGKRLASCDERDLWGEFARAISDIKPKWVLGENVRGLLSSESGRFFGRILKDLSEMGYCVGWGTFGACHAGAFHQRERVFIVAHTNGKRWTGVDKKQKGKLPGIDMPQYQQRRNEAEYLFLHTERDFTSPGIGVQRNDDGLSEGVDRLKCLGNAVVPQQVYPILKAIADIENSK